MRRAALRPLALGSEGKNQGRRTRRRKKYGRWSIGWRDPDKSGARGLFDNGIREAADASDNFSVALANGSAQSAARVRGRQ
jgi:hypothetical protein